MEEHQDSCGPVILTQTSCTSSSAPPDTDGTYSRTSQEQTGGDSERRLNTETRSCSEQREEEEEERGREEEREVEREEAVVSDNEGEEQEEDQQEDAECTEDQELLSESEEEEEEEEEDDELEEVELEEEVQVIVVQQSQERREEEQVIKEKERGGEDEEDEEEKGDEQTHINMEAESWSNTHSYSENTQQAHSEDSYSENTQQAHSEDSYSENTTQHAHSEDSYSENTTQHTHSEDSYSENAQHALCEDSYSENTTQHAHSEDSYSENAQHTLCEDSYSENTTQHTHSEDSYSENTTQKAHSEDSYSENAQHALCEDSYSENTTQHAHTEDYYSENTTQHTHAEDSYSENPTQHAHSEDCYSENAQHAHFEDSYSENTTQNAHSEDCYSENAQHAHFEDSYSENTTQNAHSEDCYSENAQHAHFEDSYSENTTQNAHSEDCYSENAQHAHFEDSYSENTTQHTHSEDPNSENTTQHAHSEDSYFEKITHHTHSLDSYSGKNRQQVLPENFYSDKNTHCAHSEDTYSEKNRQHEHSEDFYPESSTEQTLSENSYSEKNRQHAHSKDPHPENNTQHTNPEGSYFENNRQCTYGGDSYSESNKEWLYSEKTYSEKDTQQTRSEDSYSEKNTQQTRSEDSYSEKDTQQTRSEDCYTEKDMRHVHSEGSYSEKNTHQTPSEDSYSEKNTHQSHSEDSYCEMDTVQTDTEESSSAAMDAASLRTDLEESEIRQEIREEKEEEACSCEEVGGGGTADLQTEGVSSPAAQSHVLSVSTGPRPTEPHQPAVSPQLHQSAAPTGPVRLSQSFQFAQSSFYSVLLRSGALCLPGSRDRGGRALLTVCTQSGVWSNPDCDSAELLRLLLYYTSTLRKEVAALGLTVLVDAREAAPVPALFSALRSLQDNVPGSVHTVLVLITKDSALHLDKPAATQVEVLSSLKSVQKHVELHQLPAEFGGSFSFSQSSWLCFRSRVEQLTNQCEDVIELLHKTINILQSAPLPAAAQDAELLLSRYQGVMRSILEDSRLVQLQQEGGASLSWLRREESGAGVTADQRAAVEKVASLYDEVDELLHRLVTLSNAKTQQLNFIVDFSGLEAGFSEVRLWLQEVGEVRLKSLEEPEDSLELLNKKQQQFKDFHTTAYEYCRRGEALLGRLERWGDLSSADLHVYEVKVHSFWAQLQDFSQRVNAAGHNIERAVQLYSFLDQAYGWALEGMRHLAAVSMEDCTLPDKCQAVIGCLEEYQRQHLPIQDARFQEMKAAAGELRGERGLRQWSFAWSKCQETKRMLDRKMEAALRTRDSAHRQRSDSNLSRSSASSRRTLSGLWGGHDTSSSSTSSCPPEEETKASSPPRSSAPVTPQRTPLLQRLFRSISSEDSSDRLDVCSSSPSLPRLDSFTSSTPSSSSSSFFSSSRRQLRKTQSFDCPPTPEVLRYGPNLRALSEPVRRGNTGVFIRGLEVSSSEAADHTLCPRTAATGWAGRGPGTPGSPRTSYSPKAEPRPRGSKLRHVVEEMVTTEREYVRSLRYIIHHYFPEMERADLPQDLRGKRSVVFGNLEKLLDFHSQFFLRELEACWKHPLRVPHCFLRHQEQFGLYALYSKNKPKSDALLANHGNSFFRRKQVELGDKMDLSSYLLKPVQRMSKYALLLSDLIKEVGGAQEAELATLQAATNMVKFQLRHGNDLLAMDAIRDCDVNLKEQGQLIRQDEFTVWSGRRKCQRHLFLFEELILFSKPKKVEGGLDVFIYKHSFKTADVGLTESAGDDGLRFEIWFRRRTSKNQTFILQAATAEVKHAWTSGIARILWTQAARNKELRLKEMVSMGVGNKPFLDIQPSDAAISDRAVHYIMKSRGARTRASIAVSVFDHSNPFKRAAVTSDPSASGPSSSTLLGPLNLHMYSQTLSSSSSSPAAESSFITSCIEEDEQEHETSSQPSMTTESSGSSSRCLSGSTGSDSGCVSAHLQEALPEEPSPLSQPPSSSSCSSSNKQHISSKYTSPTAAPVLSPSSVV